MSSRRLKCVVARGRKISDKTVLRLFAAASGRCERPDCQTGWLWHELPNGDAVRLGEVAHIVAASDDGPRGDSAVSTSELVSVDNLLLLCPTCHTIVDGAPDEYPTERLKQWKSEHESRVRAILEVERFATRPEAHRELQRLLAQNWAVWSVYGPDSSASVDPESAGTWLREVAEVILPTNARISALLEANAELLTAEEHEVVGLFDAHRRGMEARHLGIDVGVAAPRFPAAIKTVLSDDHDESRRGGRDA